MRYSGLNSNTSIGGHGRYSEFTTDCFHGFPFGVVRDHAFYAGGPSGNLLYTIHRPLQYQCRQTAHSWTGLRVEYSEVDKSGNALPYLNVELRSTLPAPLLLPTGAGAKQVRLHFTGPTCPRSAQSLVSDQTWRVDDTDITGDERAFLIRTNSLPFLLVSSSPLRRVHQVCQRHVEWTFAEEEPRVLLVPFIDESDPDRVREHLSDWLQLVNTPPLEVSERFEESSGTMHIEQTTTSLADAPATLSPLPPFFGLMLDIKTGATKPLLQINSSSNSRTLMTTNLGPYQIADGPKIDFCLDTNWMSITSRPTREISYDPSLAPVPDELTYAGDWTWDPASPMDQLLSCRTWGNLLRAIPEPRRTELLSNLDVPSPEAFRESLIEITEPLTGLHWAKDDYLFHQKGRHVAFDTDWYNGFCLSGIERASRCGEPSLESKAHHLATECRKEREALLAYFTIFHDWQISIASMETHAPFFNTDCAHNGMEGLLAEGRLRGKENDIEGAAFCRYLAAKSALALVAAIHLPRWIEARNSTFIPEPTPGEGWTNAAPDPRLFGSMTVAPHSGILPVTPATKNPYHFAGHFPEYNALIKAHGPMEQFQEITNIWQTEFPERYTDWIVHYTGANWERRFVEKFDQEARIQAPVFYALAPEICLRLWILEEEPASIEARFQPQPINLAEQILLRAHYRLSSENDSC